MIRVDAEFSDLKGKTLINILGEIGDDEMLFVCSDGTIYSLKYYQDCCASCAIEDICGDLQDLIGSPILVAEEVSSHENPPNINIEFQDSFTWTFYKLDTIKGGVTIRWYGESNGYYSETATFELIAATH